MSQMRYDTEFGIVHVPPKDQQLDYKRIEEDEFFAKRIITKILKERRNKRKVFNPEEFKSSFVGSLSKNEEVSEYQRRMTNEKDQVEWNTLTSRTMGVDSINNLEERYTRFNSKNPEVGAL
jgi:hypothetical protein